MIIREHGSDGGAPWFWALRALHAGGRKGRVKEERVGGGGFYWEAVEAGPCLEGKRVEGGGREGGVCREL
ncbi:hypothetical protein HPP92_002989 [Vanilla planifolia]|uniref:Uncharacterized protein n=1 Tax=Vanilla planifolia TaxID=51239 RepID=A0A835RWV6_VANPL|nr:hypothetical protein HPP92_002989 [Vanilla planifolia]